MKFEPLTCETFLNLIDVYRRGTLTPADKEAFDQHKATCETCQEEYFLAMRIGELLQTNQDEFSGASLPDFNQIRQNARKTIESDPGICDKLSNDEDCLIHSENRFSSRKVGIAAALVLAAGLWYMTKSSVLEERTKAIDIASHYENNVRDEFKNWEEKSKQQSGPDTTAKKSEAEVKTTAVPAISPASNPIAKETLFLKEDTPAVLQSSESAVDPIVLSAPTVPATGAMKAQEEAAPQRLARTGSSIQNNAIPVNSRQNESLNQPSLTDSASPADKSVPGRALARTSEAAEFKPIDYKSENTSETNTNKGIIESQESRMNNLTTAYQHLKNQETSAAVELFKIARGNQNDNIATSAVLELYRLSYSTDPAMAKTYLEILKSPPFHSHLDDAQRKEVDEKLKQIN